MTSIVWQIQWTARVAIYSCSNTNLTRSNYGHHLIYLFNPARISGTPFDSYPPCRCGNPSAVPVALADRKCFVSTRSIRLVRLGNGQGLLISPIEEHSIKHSSFFSTLLAVIFSSLSCARRQVKQRKCRCGYLFYLWTTSKRASWWHNGRGQGHEGTFVGGRGNMTD